MYFRNYFKLKNKMATLLECNNVNKKFKCYETLKFSTIFRENLFFTYITLFDINSEKQFFSRKITRVVLFL